MKNSEILIKAKSIIVNPKDWTQGSLARDVLGGEALNAETAVCFCSIGAFWKLHHSGITDTVEAEDILREIVGHSIAHFNDEHEHSEVMEAFDKAIQLALEEESNDAN